jgi:hypothetical protein
MIFHLKAHGSKVVAGIESSGVKNLKGFENILAFPKDRCQLKLSPIAFFFNYL